MYRIISSNNSWLDIGVNDPLTNHTINIGQGLIEVVPWNVIIDTGGTVSVIMVILYILIVGGKNFLEGLRGEKTPLTVPKKKRKEIIDKELEVVLNGNIDVEEYEQQKFWEKYEKEKKKKERCIIFGIISWFIGGVIFIKIFSFLGWYISGDGNYTSCSTNIYIVISIIIGLYIKRKFSKREENKNNEKSLGN